MMQLTMFPSFDKQHEGFILRGALGFRTGPQFEFIPSRFLNARLI